MPGHHRTIPPPFTGSQVRTWVLSAIRQKGGDWKNQYQRAVRTEFDRLINKSTRLEDRAIWTDFREMLLDPRYLARIWKNPRYKLSPDKDVAAHQLEIRLELKGVVQDFARLSKGAGQLTLTDYLIENQDERILDPELFQEIMDRATDEFGELWFDTPNMEGSDSMPVEPFLNPPEPKESEPKPKDWKKSFGISVGQGFEGSLNADLLNREIRGEIVVPRDYYTRFMTAYGHASGFIPRSEFQQFLLNNPQYDYVRRYESPSEDHVFKRVPRSVRKESVPSTPVSTPEPEARMEVESVERSPDSQSVTVKLLTDWEFGRLTPDQFANALFDLGHSPSHYGLLWVNGNWERLVDQPSQQLDVIHPDLQVLDEALKGEDGSRVSIPEGVDMLEEEGDLITPVDTLPTTAESTGIVQQQSLGFGGGGGSGGYLDLFTEACRGKAGQIVIVAGVPRRCPDLR